MREIKFRTWVKNENKMIYGYLATAIDVFTQSFAYRSNEIELMQYTGLKDKNGKEIYEGDILKFEHKEGYANEWQVVTMDKWCWGTDEYAFYEMVERKYVFEVIGNIYENPELLEGTV